MYINFSKLDETLKNRNMTVKDLETKLGFTNGTIYAWKTRGCIPRTDRLIAVSRELGKPIEYFITEEPDEERDN